MDPKDERRLPANNYWNADFGIKSWLLTLDHKRIALLYLASLAALIVGGSGPLSIDGLRMPRQQLGRRGD